MGIGAILQQEQNPVRAIEHVRRHCVNRSVFRVFLGQVFEAIAPLRRKTHGELCLEGVFHPTSRAHVVRLDVDVLRRKPDGQAVIKGHVKLYLSVNDEGEVTNLIAYNVYP